MIALVLGGASCVWEDIDRAFSLFQPDILVAVNDIGLDWGGPIDHWVSYHYVKLMDWGAKRRTEGLSDRHQFWTIANSQVRVPGVFQSRVNIVKEEGGSSGMLAIQVLLKHLPAKENIIVDRIVLAGIPMEPTLPHYHNKQQRKPWKDGENYRKHWIKALPRLKGRVTSMSGWTANQLGMPTEAWLDSTPIQ